MQSANDEGGVELIGSDQWYLGNVRGSAFDVVATEDRVV
jgi:hypothetical protein